MMKYSDMAVVKVCEKDPPITVNFAPPPSEDGENESTPSPAKTSEQRENGEEQ